MEVLWVFFNHVLFFYLLRGYLRDCNARLVTGRRQRPLRICKDGMNERIKQIQNGSLVEALSKCNRSKRQH